MPKTRLTTNMRSRLNALARELVSAPAEEAVLTNAYQAAATLVRQTVEAALPPADMKVLKKYDVAQVDDCIRLNEWDGGDVLLFRFDGGTGPLVARSGGCRHRMFNIDLATGQAVRAWCDAVEARDAMMAQKLDDYAALIAMARHYEDVLEVWPEAERLRTQFGAGALSVFSADVVARIRADVAGRSGSSVQDRVSVDA